MNLFIKNIFFLILCFSFPFSDLFSQQNNSIFYLYNGSVYIGEVLNDEGEYLDVKLTDGNEINFPKRTVKRYLDAENIVIHPDGKYHMTRGFFFHMGLSSNLGEFGETEDEQISSHFPFLFGYYLNPRFAIGGGFSGEFNQAKVSGFQFDTQFSTQFLYGRFYIHNKKRRPFLYSRIGYGFRSDDSEFDDDNNGGFNFQAGGGFHFSSRKKSKFVLSLGYHLQKTDGRERFLDEFGSEIITNYDILIRQLIITYSIEFNKIPKRYRK